jgi:hypothetical protein
MLIDKEEFDIAKTCFDHLVDVQIVISMCCLVPMLRSFHSLMQFVQKTDVYICDYLVADITAYYINSHTRFKHDVFWDFTMLSAVRHDAIPMRWVYNALNFNGDTEEYLHLTLGG